MKRFALVLTCGLLIAGSGCCHQYPYCGGGGYGAGYAPSYGGGCPGGACQPAYPSGAYYGGGSTAMAPYGYQTTAAAPTTYSTTASAAAPTNYPTTASLNYLPAY